MFKKMVKKVLVGTCKVNGVVKDVTYNVSKNNPAVVAGKMGGGKAVIVYEDDIANKYIKAYENGTANENWLDMLNTLGYSDFSPEQYLTTRFTGYNLFSIYRLIVKEPNNAFLAEVRGKLNAFCGRVVIKDNAQLKRAVLKVIDDRLNHFSDNTEDYGDMVVMK